MIPGFTLQGEIPRAVDCDLSLKIQEDLLRRPPQAAVSITFPACLPCASCCTVLYCPVRLCQRVSHYKYCYTERHSINSITVAPMNNCLHSTSMQYTGRCASGCTLLYRQYPRYSMGGYDSLRDGCAAHESEQAGSDNSVPKCGRLDVQ